MISARIGGICVLHSLITLALSPSGPGALCILSSSNSLATTFGSTVIYPMEENGLAPFEGWPESVSWVKADWNCWLQISAFSLVSVFRIPFSLSDVIPNVSFFNDLTNEPRHDISNNVVCATNKASNQPEHSRSLIRAFASPLSIL